MSHPKSHVISMLSVLCICLLCTQSISAQSNPSPGIQHLLLHDQIPGNHPNYKPAFHEDYPGWAQMLYQHPVNYDTIDQAYRQWKREDTGNFKPIERYYKIWRRHILPFVTVDGTIEMPDLEIYYQNLLQHQLTATPVRTTTNDGEWQFLGPKETFWLNESGAPEEPAAAPWQVNIYTFDIAETDVQTIYAGTETGFVNKSVDNGLSWSLQGQGYHFGGAVTAITIDPLNADIVYVAAGNQIHKTQDGGQSWSPLLTTGQQFGADRIAMDGMVPDQVFTAGGSGIHMSNDAGATWSRVSDYRSYDLHARPDNPEVVYAISNVNGNFRVLISTDGGATFSIDASFPTQIADASGGLLAVSPAAPEYLWAILLSSDDTPLLYKGNMDENTWELITSGKTDEFPMDNWQGFFDLVLEVSPSNSDIIFTGTSSLYKSNNGGGQFSLIGGYGGAFPIHPDMQCMQLLPNGHAWISTDGGFTHSTDNFTSTQNAVAKNNNLVGSDMWGFDQGWNEDIIVGGRYHNGNTAITDFYQPKALRMGGAESPTGWVMQGKSRHVAFNDLGPGWILPKTAESQPDGRFIFSKYPNMDEYGGRRGNMVFHPNYYELIYLGEGNGFWKSSDMGVSFELLHDFGKRIRFVQIAGDDPDVIYADVVDRGLFQSTDGGYTWTAKPKLTDGIYGNSYWEGKLHIAISPTDANTIYACLQNGTWSADIGKIFKSTDGGDSWQNWTGTLGVFTKTLLIQPDSLGNDLLYLFTTNKNGKPGQCYIRRDGESDWTTYGESYPSGMAPNHALPFFRDGKLRVAGGGGIWENTLDQPVLPIIRPWVERPFFDCKDDTLHFDDHSILNHENASWSWEIKPAPAYIDDPNTRNPMVVLGSTGSYDVTLTVVNDGISYATTVENMVEAVECPSLENCDNPAILPKANWSLLFVDSEEINYPGLATMAFDDDPGTIWHTRWSTGSDPYPHEIQIDLGEAFNVHEFTYFPRQNGQNGWIDEYELYISEDADDWGPADTIGRFENSSAPHLVALHTPATGRYIRLVALSEVNGNAWASAAEFSIKGCFHETTATSSVPKIETLKAFPVPTQGVFEVSLPSSQLFTFGIYTMSGKQVVGGKSELGSDTLQFDLSELQNGMYVIRLVDENGRAYLVKVVKQ